jgi:ATP-binding cassette subfamily F protein 3
MESCDSLLEAIDSFDGAVIIVTHNEMFLHAIAERLIVFQRDGLSVLEGTYQSFLEKYGWEDEESSPNSIRKDVCTNKNEESITKKEFRRVRSEFFSERSKTLKPLEERILEVEKDIDAREKELKIFNAEMLEASGAKDGKKIVEISLSMHKCQSAIDRLFDELEKLSNTFQQQKSLFQTKLDQIEKQLALKNQI